MNRRANPSKVHPAGLASAAVPAAPAAPASPTAPASASLAELEEFIEEFEHAILIESAPIGHASGSGGEAAKPAAGAAGSTRRLDGDQPPRGEAGDCQLAAPPNASHDFEALDGRGNIAAPDLDPHIGLDPHIKWARIVGSSMADKDILPGDWLAVATNIEAADGDVILAEVSGFGCVARTLRIIGGAMLLKAASPDVPSIAIADPADIKIHGVAIGRVRAPSPRASFGPKR